MNTYPGITGIQYGDEPQEWEMPSYGTYINALQQAFPDLLIYSNANPGSWLSNPSYESYTQLFVNQTHSDVIMVDLYPFDTDGDADYYYYCLMTLRNAAKQVNRPYWMYIQSYEDLSNQRRLPSESDYRMQVYVALAAGYQGFGNFVYDGYPRALVDVNGDPTVLYPTAADVNAELANLGNTLRFLTSTAVEYLPGPTNSVPRGLYEWQPGNGDDPHLSSITVHSENPSENGMIGHFEDDQGNRFFMIVNTTHGAGLSSAETPLAFTLTFLDVDHLYHINRETGHQEIINLTNKRLTIVLPGGTGELYGYSAFPLPGDANGDGMVNLSGLQILGDNWQSTTATWSEADFTGDGKVDLADLQIIGDNWGYGTSLDLDFNEALQQVGVTIPEPTSVILLLTGVLMLRRRVVR
ncbi:MAG: PEP-CTERM sorting domain-containing protein [Phycisphaeraceae bacterium]|nr:PEP-CTERM sorting domain-containing protein [Phycisphaeraceae bacterium]